jgi:7,8-dihydro-6-hydroxymethylpterin dimethyltransferase
LLKNISNIDPADRTGLLEKTRKRMAGVYTPNQVLGRTQTIGCAAVEITQRCNLDCTLCYLSEHSESVQDIPIEEVFRRLDAVVYHYGTGAHVQITGGDPTLRKHSELIKIVRYAHNIGLYPALFTNGIAASRKLLEQLTMVGLSDVAFHVDTTQQRKGYTSEQSLNKIRLDYIERVRGLGLMVIFNTTIHNANIDEIPMLIDFFIDHSDSIGLASFQLQADTGRGILGKREIIVSQQNVRKKIEDAAGKRLPWDLIQIGHRLCHSYMPLFIVGRGVYPVVEDQKTFEEFLNDFKLLREDRHSNILKLTLAYAKALVNRPQWWFRCLNYLAGTFWRMKHDLLHSKGKINKLSIFIHDFMDANNLIGERVDACSFMVMTSDGPVSMCAHNAKRDEYITRPITFKRQDGRVIRFNPLPN